MAARHRIPTIFTLSMVDVLCCALGCVILLWLVNSQEAKRRAKVAGDTTQQLFLSKTELATVRSRLTGLEADLRDWQSRNQALAISLHKETLAQLDLKKLLESKELRLVTLDEALKDRNAKYLALTNRAEDLDLKLASSKKLTAQLEELLARLRKESGDLTTKVVAGEKKATDLSKQLASNQTELERLMKQLNELFADKKLLEQVLTARGKELKQAQLVIGSLQEDKKDLLKQAQLMKVAIANRFEGIELKAKKVVFLVDMSGSMKLLDENTKAPDKWPLVCEALMRLLLSLGGEITHFQVILFSDRLLYPVGQANRWEEFKGEATAKAVKERLLQIDPKGGTNMYSAFEEAFKFRTQGLDTVYLLSDGLPTDEDNLPADGAALRGVERTTFLARRIRTQITQNWNRRLENQPQVRIHSIGFFYESPDVGSFLWALSRENQGSFVGMSRP